jgi:hypothetical protein
MWLFLSFLLFPVTVRAQALCPVQEALAEATHSRCLSDSGKQNLLEFLTNPLSAEVPRRQVLNIVSASYRCSLENAPPARAVSCSQSGIAEHVYTHFKEDRELCLVDRLTRASANLRYVLDLKIPSSRRIPDTELDRIYSALSDVQFAVRISREIQEHSGDPGQNIWVLRNARNWCVDTTNPAFPELYLRDALDSTAALAVEHPEIGTDLGAAFASFLADAKQLYGWVDDNILFGKDNLLLRDWRLLVSIDRANLGSTGVFLNVVRKLEAILPDPRRIRRDEVQNVFDKLVRLRPELEKAAERLRDKSEAWKYFEPYSEHLFALASALTSNRDHNIRNAAMREANLSLWRGFELSASSGTTAGMTCIQERSLQRENAASATLASFHPLKSCAQEKLMSRVTAFGMELAGDLDYRSLADFESRFLDDTGRTVPVTMQCNVHAHLAQAYYVLTTPETPEGNRKYREHMDQSCGRVLQADLQKLRDSLRTWPIQATSNLK